MMPGLARLKSRRRLLIGGNVAFQILLAFWLLLVVNVWAFRHSWRVDLTQDRRYSPSQESIAVLHNLDAPVQIVIPYAFSAKEAQKLVAKVLMKAIRTSLELEMIKPDRLQLTKVLDIARDPTQWETLKKRFKLDEPNRVYLFSGDRRQVLTPQDLATFRFPSATNPNVRPEIVSEQVEEALIGAIQRVASNERPIVVFSQGSNEMSADALIGRTSLYTMQRLRSSLEDRGYDVRAVDLRKTPRLPEDTRLLVIVGGGGSQDFVPIEGDERNTIVQYLESGGSLLLFMPLAGRTGLEGVLDRYGVHARKGVIYYYGRTRSGSKAATPHLFVRKFDGNHAITHQFHYGQFLAELDGFRALAVKNPPATALLFSDDSCWLETEKTPRRDETDPVGSFPLVAASETTLREVEPHKSRIVVFGSWSPALDGAFQGGTRRVILNSVFWLTGREKLAVGGGNKKEASRRIELTDPVRNTMFWMSLVGIPLCTLSAGLLTYFVRRSKS